jgi:hypothetical protein
MNYTIKQHKLLKKKSKKYLGGEKNIGQMFSGGSNGNGNTPLARHGSTLPPASEPKPKVSFLNSIRKRAQNGSNYLSKSLKGIKRVMPNRKERISSTSEETKTETINNNNTDPDDVIISRLVDKIKDTPNWRQLNETTQDKLDELFNKVNNDLSGYITYLKEYINTILKLLPKEHETKYNEDLKIYNSNSVTISNKKEQITFLLRTIIELSIIQQNLTSSQNTKLNNSKQPLKVISKKEKLKNLLLQLERRLSELRKKEELKTIRGGTQYVQSNPGGGTQVGPSNPGGGSQVGPSNPGRGTQVGPGNATSNTSSELSTASFITGETVSNLESVTNEQKIKTTKESTEKSKRLVSKSLNNLQTLNGINRNHEEVNTTAGPNETINTQNQIGPTKNENLEDLKHLLEGLDIEGLDIETLRKFLSNEGNNDKNAIALKNEGNALQQQISEIKKQIQQIEEYESGIKRGSELKTGLESEEKKESEEKTGLKSEEKKESDKKTEREEKKGTEEKTGLESGSEEKVVLKKGLSPEQIATITSNVENVIQNFKQMEINMNTFKEALTKI